MTSYTNADFHPHMECHLAGGDKPDLLQEVERMGSVTQFLERGCTLHYSGVAPGQRQQAAVGLLIASQLSYHVLESTAGNERVTSLPLWVGDRSLVVVCVYWQNSSAEYPAFFGVPGRGT